MPEPAIVGIENPMSTGKTSLMTAMLLKQWARGEKIAATYHLKGIDYEYIDDIYQLEKLRNCVIGGDDIWKWFFARRATSEVNELMIDVIINLHKRGNYFIYTQQYDTLTDRAIRNVTDDFIYVHTVKRIGFDRERMLPLYKWVEGNYLNSRIRVRYHLPTLHKYFDRKEEVKKRKVSLELYRDIVLEVRNDKDYDLFTYKDVKVDHIVKNYGVTNVTAMKILNLVESDKWK
jgi:hypothetical protein